MRYVVPIKDSEAKTVDIQTPYPYKASAQPKSTIEAANGGTMYFVAVSSEESKATAVGVYAITNTSALNTAASRPTSLDPRSLRFHLALAPAPRFVGAPDPVPQRGPGTDGIQTNAGNPFVSVVLVLGKLWASWAVGWPGRPTLSALTVAQVTPRFRVFQGQLQLSAEVSFFRVLRVPGYRLIFPALAFTRYCCRCHKRTVIIAVRVSCSAAYPPSPCMTTLPPYTCTLPPSPRLCYSRFGKGLLAFLLREGGGGRF